MSEEAKSSQEPTRAKRHPRELAQKFPEARKMSFHVSNTASETAKLFGKGKPPVRPIDDPDFPYAQIIPGNPLP